MALSERVHRLGIYCIDRLLLPKLSLPPRTMYALKDHRSTSNCVIYIRSTTLSIAIRFVCKRGSRRQRRGPRRFSYTTMSHGRLCAVDTYVYGRNMSGIDADTVGMEPFGTGFAVKGQLRIKSVGFMLDTPLNHVLALGRRRIADTPCTIVTNVALPVCAWGCQVRIRDRCWRLVEDTISVFLHGR